MIDFFLVKNALASAINTDPVLCLVHLTAWLDPLWSEDDDWNMPQDEDDTLYIALRILRGAFPDIYFDALMAIRGGATHQRLDRLICNGVQEQGIPLDDLEWLPFGIPLPTYGASPENAEFYTEHPDTLPVLACFGISPDLNSYSIDVPDMAYNAATIIADNLAHHEDEDWRNVAWLLRWLFSQTGNSSVDWDYEMMAEVQPLAWEAEDIAFAIEIIEEANGIMADVASALQWISQYPVVLDSLTRNIHKVYLKKGNENARYEFEWSCPAQYDERTAQSVA